MTKYAKIVRFEDTVDAESLVDSKIGDYFLDTYSLPFSSLLMKKRYFYAYLVLFLSTVCNAIALFSMFTQPLSFLGWICFFLDVALMVLIVITYIFVRNFVTNYLRILLIIDGKKISGDILTRKLKIVK